MGRRFNGHDLHLFFLQKGIKSSHLVWQKNSDDPNTSELLNSRFLSRALKKISAMLSRLENRLSLQSLLYPAPLFLLLNKKFLFSDIVHYHLLHTGYFSLLALPLLSRIKPAVWTLHDPWAMTGHCVHPFGCEKWKSGCGSCPSLDISFAMKRDNTAFMWKLKRFVYSVSKLDIIVASKFMLNMVQDSPLFVKAKVHYIPFGIDLDIFSPPSPDEKNKKRTAFGIEPGNTVICVRAMPGDFKGIEYIHNALEKITTSKPITILAFNTKGMFDRYRDKHQIIDLGWIEDLQSTVDAYQVSDIFLMPSVAESFGMMAIEAMACGKPVIVFEGTTLPDVIFASERGGKAVRYRDSDALATALTDLIDNPEESVKIGAQARKIALQHYDLKTHSERILNVYKEILTRKN